MRQILLLIIAFLCQQLYGQQTWSVDECMSYAARNSFATARATRNVQTAKENYISAIGRHLPQLSATVGANGNFGRGIDPATNTYVNTATFNNTYGLNVSLPVFNALELLNNTLMNKVAVARSRSELQKAEDDVALDVMTAYVDVQYGRGLVLLTERRVETLRRDLELAQRREQLGVVSSADVAQFAATLASEELTLVTRSNEYQTSMLRLKDLMNFPLEDTLLTIDAIEPVERPRAKASDIYADAASYLPAMDVLKKQLTEQRYALNMAKSVYYPSLSVSGSVSSNYFTTLGPNAVSALAFGRQLTNNMGQYVGANLSIPIFKGLSARTQVHRAKIAYNQAKSDYDEQMRALRVEIEQAVMDLNAAEAQTLGAQKSVAAYKIAHRAAKEKYVQGMLGVIELQTSANQLLLSEVELLKASLTLQIKSREVGYFAGEPLFNK